MLNDTIREFIYENSNEFFRCKLKLNTAYGWKYDTEFLINHFAEFDSETQKKIIKESSENQRLGIFEHQFQSIGYVDSEEKYNLLIDLIKSYYDNDLLNDTIHEFIYKNSNEFFRCKLKLNTDYGWKYDMEFSINHFAEFDKETQNEIIVLVSEPHRIELFKHQFQAIGYVDSKERYNALVELIRTYNYRVNYHYGNYNAYLLKDSIFKYIYENSNVYYWLNLTFIFDFLKFKKSKYRYYLRNWFVKSYQHVISIIDINVVGNHGNYNKLIDYHNSINNYIIQELKKIFIQDKAIQSRLEDIKAIVYEPFFNEIAAKSSDEFKLKLFFEGYSSELDETLLEKYVLHYLGEDFQDKDIKDNIITYMNSLKQIGDDNEFLDLEIGIKIAMKKIEKEECVLLIRNIYDNQTNFCKIKMYLNQYVNLTKEEAEKEIYRIFRHQYFRLRYSDKMKFIKKAKEQLPNFKHEQLRKIETAIKDRKDEDGNDIVKVYFKDIWFENGKFKVLLNEDDTNPIYSKWYYWDFAKEGFNILQSYFSELQKGYTLTITISQKGEILRTEELEKGLEELEMLIVVVIKHKSPIEKEIKQIAENNLDDYENRYALLTLKDIKKLTNEENSECVSYLFDNLLKTNIPIYVAETLSDQNNFEKIGSWLFTIPVNESEYAIVWESQKLDRATHLFKIEKEKYTEILNNIKDYIFDEQELFKRRRLHSSSADDIALKNKLCYWTHIDHDWRTDCRKWYNDIKQLIPNLEERKIKK